MRDHQDGDCGFTCDVLQFLIVFVHPCPHPHLFPLRLRQLLPHWGEQQGERPLPAPSPRLFPASQVQFTQILSFFPQDLLLLHMEKSQSEL